MAIEEIKAPVATKHAVYLALEPKWTKTMVVYGGEDDVHEAAELLLPRLQQQDDDDYLAYVERTRFLNAFQRTVEGLEGTATRKDPVITAEEIADYLDNIDGDGTTLNKYVKKAINKVLLLGVCGTLVDYSESDGELTQAEAEQKNLRPKLSFYKTENIINWRFKTINNSVALVLLVLREIEEIKLDEFTSKEVYRYRVCRIDEETGVYTQQIYSQENGSLNPGDINTPLMNNEPLKRIPFYWHGEYGNPPLYDLVTTNIKHYQLKADHNHVLHFIGLPQPYRCGVDPDDKKLPKTIGPVVIWDLENENAKVGYLELEGKSIECIENELNTIKEDMAFLGAAMLMSDAMVKETATKANIRNSDKTSSLSSICIDVSYTLTEALKLFAEWAGVADTSNISVNIPTDFNPNRLTAQDILALVQSWQSGAFSKRTLYENFQDGDIIAGTRTFEEEEELIQKGE